MDSDSLIAFEAAGLAGVAVYLGSYAALQAGLVRGNGYLYAALNIIAASLVLVSMMSSFNLSSLLIQVSWIVISLFGVVRFYLLTRGLSFSAEEQHLVESRLADLPRLTARRLLDAGAWHDLPAGHPLARRGEPLGRLAFLHRGRAVVSIEGKKIAEVPAGGLIGELTVLHGGPASADVVLAEESRVFVVSAAALKALTARDSELRMHLELSFGRDSRQKLLAGNARLDATESAT